jgi:hypothetical protein
MSSVFNQARIDFEKKAKMTLNQIEEAAEEEEIFTDESMKEYERNERR